MITNLEKIRNTYGKFIGIVWLIVDYDGTFPIEMPHKLYVDLDNKHYFCGLNDNNFHRINPEDFEYTLNPRNRWNKRGYHSRIAHRKNFERGYYDLPF